jgi:YD repeat-containing protein
VCQGPGRGRPSRIAFAVSGLVYAVTVVELGRTRKFAYDAADRLVAEVDPAGKAATYVYDPVSGT